MATSPIVGLHRRRRSRPPSVAADCSMGSAVMSLVRPSIRRSIDARMVDPQRFPWRSLLVSCPGNGVLPVRGDRPTGRLAQTRRHSQVGKHRHPTPAHLIAPSRDPERPLTTDGADVLPGGSTGGRAPRRSPSAGAASGKTRPRRTAEIWCLVPGVDCSTSMASKAKGSHPMTTR